MRDDPILDFAARYRVPVPIMRRIAAEIAEQCALVANRFEPRGDLVALELALVEAVGAEIGSAILATFPWPVEPPPVKQNYGIGGPRGSHG